MTATLDWYGCATFRLRLGELVVFLDAYIDRAEGAAGTGLTAGDVDRCDFVVVGHSHFDHLWGAERIARNTGATIIGSFETARVMAAQGVPLGQVPYQDRQERLAELGQRLESLGPAVADHLRSSEQGARGDGGALCFVFDTPQGRLFYQDTSGYWTGMVQGLRPDVAIIAAAGRGTIDGEPIQGSLAQFVGREAALMRPRRIVLGHHDNWLPGFGAATDLAPFRAELARFTPGVALDELGYLDGHQLFGAR